MERRERRRDAQRQREQRLLLLLLLLSVAFVAAALVLTIVVSLVVVRRPPQLDVALEPPPNPAGWHETPPVIAVDAQGRGDPEVRCRLLRAPSGSPELAADSRMPLPVSAEGVTEVTCLAENSRGRVSEEGTVTIRLDTTDPTIVGAASPPPNANGWNNSTVTVSFTCNDYPSGVTGCPGPRTLDREGAGQSVIGTVADLAGRRASTEVGAINIDLTPPTIEAPTHTSDGGVYVTGTWTNRSVIVTFLCGDLLSGKAGGDGSVTIAGEGARQTVCGVCTDRADNGADRLVTDINIDKTGPELSATLVPPPNDAGWHRGDVTVTWTCADALSGLAGDCPPDAIVAGEGLNLTAFAAVADRAGNRTERLSATVDIDRTRPVIAGSRTPAAGLDGWTNTDVVVSFSCEEAGVTRSGIKTNTVAGRRLTGDGANQSVTSSGDCIDRADNEARPATVGGINIDKTRPAITLTGRTPPSAAGWNGGDVTLTWTCTDALSGVVARSVSATVRAEGANQQATGVCTDLAGNTAADVQTVSIDRTSPTIGTAAATAGGAVYSPGAWTNQAITVTFTCRDEASGSGVAGDAIATQTVDGETAARFVVSGACVDRAGNGAPLKVFGPIRIDRTLPVLSATATTEDGGEYRGGVWTSQRVTVRFTCRDEGAVQSGVHEISATGAATGSSKTSPLNVTVTSEGKEQSVLGVCTDVAGNRDDDELEDIDIDLSPPAINLVSRTLPNSYGWNNTAVTVTWACSDAVSGPVAAQVTKTLTSEGADQTLTGECVDLAGLTSPPDVQSEFNIDMTLPTVTFAGNKSTYGILDTIAITCTPADVPSGVAFSTCAPISGPAYLFEPDTGQSSVVRATQIAHGAAQMPGGPRTITRSASATDRAGNQGGGSTSFSVIVTFEDLCTLSRQFVEAGAALGDPDRPLSIVAPTATFLTTGIIATAAVAGTEPGAVTVSLPAVMCQHLREAGAAARQGNHVAKADAMEGYLRAVETAAIRGLLTPSEAKTLRALAAEL